ncbi:MAG TPA: oligosaccharide flippase family protein, partial [Burkholderiaceae bacterium]|nr:oligosaccharide flippase family protein [Burkholderiaceae bacterium]
MVATGGWKEIARLAIAQASGALFGLATLVVTARVLGAEGRGIVAATLAWVTLGATIASLSLGHALIRHAQTHPNSTDTNYTGTLLRAAFGLGGLGTIVWMVANASGEAGALQWPSLVAILGALLLPFTVWEQYASGLFAFKDRVSDWSRVLFRTRFISAALAIGAVALLHTGPAGVLAAALCGQLFL